MERNENSKIVTRLAELAEAPVIAGLLVGSFAEYQYLYTKRAFSATTLGTYKIKKRIYQKIMWVVLVDEVICGTISLLPEGNTLHIKSVAVSPSSRRKGLGGAMMRHVEAIALKGGFHFLELTTTPFLKDVIKLYESHGFRACGQKDLYGTPLLRMIKSVKSVDSSSTRRVHVFE